MCLKMVEASKGWPVKMAFLTLPEFLWSPDDEDLTYVSFPLEGHLESLRGHAPWKARPPRQFPQGRLLIVKTVRVGRTDEPRLHGPQLRIELHEAPLGNPGEIRW